MIAILAGYSLRAPALPRRRPPFGTAVFITYLVPPDPALPAALPGRGVARASSDTIWALIVTYPTFLVPFSTWLLMGYFRTIPREVEECALVDGASRMQTLMQIVLPMAVPGIVCVALFGFTLTWNEFTYALTFVSQTANKTAVVGVTADLIRGDIYYWGSLMAGRGRRQPADRRHLRLVPGLLRLGPHCRRRQGLGRGTHSRHRHPPGQCAARMSGGLARHRRARPRPRRCPSRRAPSPRSRA